MRILVIGATGPTGRQIVDQSLAAGHEVTACVRGPDSKALPSGARVVKADVLDRASLAEAVKGQQAVISSLGTRLSRKPTTLLSEGTRNLIAAMTDAGARRFICITGIGAGDSRGHGGFVYDRIIQPLLLKEIYKDKDRQEAVVSSCGLEWTIVRPGALTNGPRTWNYKVHTDLTGVTIGKISRADVAAFILQRLEDPSAQHSTYTLSY